MKAKEQVPQLQAALIRMLMLHDTMMGEINHKASWYTAETIREMNEAPAQARRAIKASLEEP